MVDNDNPDHGEHDVMPFNERFDTKQPKVHEGIMWCEDCNTDFVPQPQPAR